MTAVISFPVDRVSKPGPARGGHRGEVIIFPGERIERMEFSLADRIPARAGRAAAQARQLDFDQDR